MLYRAYFEEGTNGALFNSDKFLCHTIELPWNDNKRNTSCIPEGTYEVEPRFSKRFKHHLILKDVKGRSFILFHPANDALKELQGCIAPVTYLGGIKAFILKKLCKNCCLWCIKLKTEKKLFY